MADIYQGKPVTVVRTAKQGDPGFDATKNQVIIQVADATGKVAEQDTVLRSDVHNKP